MNKMTLSEPVKIPEQYRQAVIEFLRGYWEDMTWQLRNHFGVEFEIDDIPNTDDDYLRLMVADSIETIARAASGDTSGLDRAEVHDHVQGLVERMFAVPNASSYDIPRSFWESPFGSMVMLALVWAQGDKLISIQEAVEMTGRPHYWFGRQIDSGKLTSYPDMSEPNPRRRNRLLLSEVKKVKKAKATR